MAFQISKKTYIPQLPRLQTPLFGDHTFLKVDNGKMYFIDPSGILRRWNLWEYFMSGQIDNVVSGSAFFNGSTATGDSYWLHINNSDEITFGDSSFSFAGWFYYRDAGNPPSDLPLISKWGGTTATNEYLLELTTSGTLRFSIGDGSSSSTLDTPTGHSGQEWSFAAGGFDSSSNKIWAYLNGNYATGLYTNVPLSSGNQNFNVGARGGDTATNTLDAAYSGEMAFWGQWDRSISSGHLDFLNNGQSGAYTFDRLSNTYKSGIAHFWPLVSGYNSLSGYSDQSGNLPLQEGHSINTTPFSGNLPPLADPAWILAGGFWDDSGFWDDDAVWVD